MKKKSVIIFVLALLLGIGVDKLVLTNKKEDLSTENSIQKKNTRTLSMMLETGAGTGEYEQTTRESWPTDGYKFNAELSKCENGGKLSWDSENNTVVMTGSTSDKCYVYFDVHDPLNSPTIAFNDSNQIAISGTTSESEVTYYYSFDNENFTEGSIIPISESGKVYVYAEDEANNKSEVISKDIEISSAVNGSVTSSYYCSSTGTYQSSSTCTVTYLPEAVSSGNCPSGSTLETDGKHIECIFNLRTKHYSDSDSCKSACLTISREVNASEYQCKGALGSVDGSLKVTSYYCTYTITNNAARTVYFCEGGKKVTSSSSSCTKTVTGTLKYKCSLNNTYYGTQSEANSVCLNQCSSGSYYDNKCYVIK